MLIDTEKLRKQIQDYYATESEKEKTMGDSHAIAFLTRLEKAQYDDENIIDNIEFLASQYKDMEKIEMARVKTFAEGNCKLVEAQQICEYEQFVELVCEDKDFVVYLYQ